MNQKEALDIIKMGYNVFLTGSAGSGKTFLLCEYISYLKKNNIDCAVTASTGIAATHLDGRTIHSWSGIGTSSELTKELIDKILGNKKIKKRISNSHILIIDEISMLSADTLDTVDKVYQTIRKNTEPFGGVQVILSGDFLQLPPVSRLDDDFDTKFAFESEVWKKMSIKICYISEQYRHEDGEYYNILSKIRTNTADIKIRDTLLSRQNKTIKDVEKPTKLFSHNLDVNELNDLELAQIKNEPTEYIMKKSGNKWLVKSLCKGCLAPEKLVLKKDAIVMFVKNNFNEGYVNGTLGRVVGFNTDGHPEVQTKNGIITAVPASWTIEENHKIVATVTQIPLRLAWAITIHKSQGMTLDAAVMNLGKTFEYGMGYVALSRLKSLKGLSLQAINDIALKVDPSLVNQDKTFIEQSNTDKSKILSINKSSIRKEQKKILKLYTK
ncbi:AAA family ATPase [Patescibacteria group bacterium]|nr:AAA family ATPase [Patescibacteria group bacterium]MBU1891106.1 AAA family ATPase [Patescibacteria group bacterium]